MFTLLRSLFVALIVLPILSKVGRIVFSIFVVVVMGFIAMDWLAQGG